VSGGEVPKKSVERGAFATLLKWRGNGDFNNSAQRSLPNLSTLKEEAAEIDK
jgi:hypothetical protein